MLSSSPRNWFPVILAGLTVVLAVVFYAMHQKVDVSALIPTFDHIGSADGNGQTAEDGEKLNVAPTDDEYQTAVRTIFASYTSDHNAQAAYDAFIQLHVPASMQTFHIDLIIAFAKLAAGNTTDGQARLDALTAQYSWLSM